MSVKNGLVFSIFTKTTTLNFNKKSPLMLFSGLFQSFLHFFLRIDDPHRISADKCPVRHILMDKRSGGHNCAISYFHPGQNGRVGTNHHFVPDQNFADPVFVNQILMVEWSYCTR